MRVILHGTRGAYPTSSIENQKYGGNTSCIEIIEDDQRLIVDAGTGILGIDFDAHYTSDRIDILLTHLHLDHIQGLGFCKPLFNPKKDVHLWGPGGSTHSLQSRLNRFLSPPLFPVVLRDIPCNLQIHELPNTTFSLGRFVITSEFISHPGPTVGFRIQSGSKILTYIPDHEPVLGRAHLYNEDDWVSGLGLAMHTNLLIHDSQYSDEEYLDKVGWGHCSLEMAAEYSVRAHAERLILFHHNPAHSDDFRTQMFETFMKKGNYDFPIELAVQGQEIDL